MINLHERILPTQRGSNPQSPDHHSDAHPIEPPRPALPSKKGSILKGNSFLLDSFSFRIKMAKIYQVYSLIVFGFNDTSTLVDHFVVSQRRGEEKQKRYSSRGDERERHRRKRKMNESEEIKNISPLPLPAARTAGLPNFKQISAGRSGDARNTTPWPHPTTPIHVYSVPLNIVKIQAQNVTLKVSLYVIFCITDCK